jgi:hypothetical protein
VRRTTELRQVHGIYAAIARKRAKTLL